LMIAGCSTCDMMPPILPPGYSINPSEDMKFLLDSSNCRDKCPHQWVSTGNDVSTSKYLHRTVADGEQGTWWR
jgi:hypothetical protein